MYTITLEVNQICNLRCTYCYLGRKTNQKMSEQIAYKGLEIAFLNAENHRDRRLWVDFVGGEALLSLSFLKHLVDYIEGQALKRNILVTYSITTNGTILNDEILAWLIKYRIHLKVSIDGDEETHNKTERGLMVLEVILILLKTVCISKNTRREPSNIFRQHMLLHRIIMGKHLNLFAI